MRSARSVVAASCAAVLTAAAQAVPVDVSFAGVYKASTGTSISDSATAFGPGASAQVAASPGIGAASAFADLIHASASAEGLGTGTMGVGSFINSGVSAYASVEYEYWLWDPIANRALTWQEAAGITLDFGFIASGMVDIGMKSLSQGGVNFGANLQSSVLQSMTSPGLAVTYGPVSPPPGQLFAEDYVKIGDLSLYGQFQRTFSLTHSDSPSGHLDFGVRAGSTNVAQTSARINLESVSVSGRGSFTGSFVLMFLDGVDRIQIPVTIKNGSTTPPGGGGSGGGTVPTPQTFALVCLGILAGTVCRLPRRRLSRAHRS